MFNVSEDILEEIKNYDEKILPYEQLGAIEPTTFLEELLSWKEKWNHKTAVIFDDKRITYGQLEEKTRHLANGLYARGIRKGDHAVMHMGNSIHFVIVLFALFRMGVKPVMMLNTHRENELKPVQLSVYSTKGCIPASYYRFNGNRRFTQNILNRISFIFSRDSSNQRFGKEYSRGNISVDGGYGSYRLAKDVSHGIS